MRTGGHHAPRGANGDARPYAASRLKRKRATQAEMEERAAALLAIAKRSKPCTVRQVFYQATVHGIVEKTERGYEKVQRALVGLRRSGRLPWGWIADNTRWQRKPITFDSLAEAIENTAQTYRRAVWADLDTYLEVWLEKDALSGVLLPVTSLYDVPLMVARGYSSLTFLQEAASYMRELEKNVVVVHFGDFDPSGQDAADKIEETLREFAPEIELTFIRAAVTPEQIAQWSLPSRPTKTTDARAKTWTGGDSVELDAIEANRLRNLCQAYIEDVIPEGWLDRIKAAEASERELLTSWTSALAQEIAP
jgi:hypothetical protein